MARQVNSKILQAMEKELEQNCGYHRFQIEGRNSYIAIDEYKRNGCCSNTYRCGLTKKEAYYILYDLNYILRNPNKEE